ncbi:MAG: helicase-related protein [Thermoprotei archaeon]
MEESLSQPLKDWQQGVVRSISDGYNVLTVAPTGSGKSHLALYLCNTHNRVLWVFPTKALTREWFMKAFSMFEGSKSVNIYTGDFRRETSAYEGDLVFATYESAILQLRRRDPWFKELKLVVFDEFQFLGDNERGGVIEEFLILLSELNPEVSLLALSATINNPQDVAQWLTRIMLKRTAVHELSLNHRPTRLLQHAIKFKHDGEKVKYLLSLMKSNPDKQFLVFVPRRAETEQLARLFSSFRIRTGIHHAGLDRLTRISSEDMFRAGKIQALFCTATLQFGVNLPAHFVVIYDPVWDTRRGEFRLSTNDYLQMAGRAGRPIVSPISGESITQGTVVVLATGSAEYAFVRNHLINNDPEPVVSSFETDLVYRINGLLLYKDEYEIRRLLSKSFARLNPGRVSSALRALYSMKFLREGSLTQLGRFVAQLNLNPFAAYRFVNALQDWWRLKDVGEKAGRLVLEELKRESSSYSEIRDFSELCEWEFVVRRYRDGHLLFVNHLAPQVLRDRAAWYMYAFEKLADFLGRSDLASSIARQREKLEGSNESEWASSKLRAMTARGQTYIEVAIREYNTSEGIGRSSWLGLDVLVPGAPRGWFEPVKVNRIEGKLVWAELNTSSDIYQEQTPDF